jgi:hypothetical protein
MRDKILNKTCNYAPWISNAESLAGTHEVHTQNLKI